MGGSVGTIGRVGTVVGSGVGVTGVVTGETVGVVVGGLVGFSVGLGMLQHDTSSAHQTQTSLQQSLSDAHCSSHQQPPGGVASLNAPQRPAHEPVASARELHCWDAAG